MMLAHHAEVDFVDEVVCRSMEERDVVRVHQIHTDCLRRSLAGYYALAQIDVWLKCRSPRGYRHAVMAGEEYLVAECEGVVVAFASWRGNELNSLFVAPDMQRSGFGSLLLRRCDRLAKLDHVKATLNAAGFYKRFGFEAGVVGHVDKRGVRIPYLDMRRT